MPDEKGKGSIPIYGTIDERTRAVVNQGDAYACRFVIYALMLYAAYHLFRYHEARWDLWGLAMITSIISTAYQIKHKVININGNRRPIIIFTAIIALLSVIISVVASFIGHVHR